MTDVPSDGLSWSWDLDLEGLLAAVTGPAPWTGGAAAETGGDAGGAVDQDAVLAEYLEAVDAGRARVLPLPVVAGRVAESLPAGPELAGWAAAGQVTELEDGALAGMASSYRRLASWAQAGELEVVAELASRSAAADAKIGTDTEGRPARLPEEACAQVSLGLVMSELAAGWWADLAVTLRWRLAATGAALRSGVIDLARARAIVEATAGLDEQTARAVEAAILEGAGDKTLGQLRARLRRAVIAADPAGAERRRERAERQARVMLYPDAEGTAALAGYQLPGIPATAAMARITALAKALQASGAGGGIDLLRSQVFLGLLLGTLPYIPPPADGPPDDGPDGDGPDDAPFGWPEVPAFLNPGPAALGHLAPAGGGLLDLRLSWGTLTGTGLQAGYLGRLGPITPAQAAHLAGLAVRDPAVDWRVIVTGPDGRAVAVTRLPRPAARERDGPASPAGLVSRVTVTITQDCLGDPPPSGTGDLAPVLARVLAAANRAAAEAAERAAADAQADGGCAHAEASPAYRPPPRLAEYVTARDLTCRFGTCRQPAWRCDLDHTTPYLQGGRTCPCNLGPLCRYHHQLKQRPGWTLTQDTPGTFTWTTPMGRSYVTEPDSHAA
jgi:hypothetical protein